MKRVNLTSFIVLLLAVFAFSSCLDSDNEPSWDEGGYMTVEEYLGSPILIPDYSPDYVYIPNNPDALRLYKDNVITDEYLERGSILIKFSEGEVFPQEDKTMYKVNIVRVNGILNVKDMIEKPESIEDSNPLAGLSKESDYWGANGYVNVAFYPTYESGKENEFDINDFDLFIDKVDDEILYLRLNHSISKIENPMRYESYYPLVTSFRIDSRQLKEDYPDLIFGSANDSIRVKITALGLDEELESPEFPIKLK